MTAPTGGFDPLRPLQRLANFAGTVLAEFRPGLFLVSGGSIWEVAHMPYVTNKYSGNRIHVTDDIQKEGYARCTRRGELPVSAILPPNGPVS